MWAAKMGHPAVVDQLLEAGAKLDHESHGGTALRLAVFSGELEIARSLLKRGADPRRCPNSRYGTIVHLAAEHPDPALAQLFINHGVPADEFSETVHGTPLHVAAWRGNAGTIECLVNAGAEIERTGEFGRSPLHLAAIAGETPAVRMLLTHGADPTAQDSLGRTPLHLAAETGRLPAIGAILSWHGRDALEVGDKHGWTPLHVASFMGHADCVSYLLGDDVEVATDTGRTALHLVAMSGNLRAFDELVRAGASVSQTDQFGLTALDLLNEFRPDTVDSPPLDVPSLDYPPTLVPEAIESVERDPPVLLLYRHDGYKHFGRKEGVLVAIWADGTILFSPDRTNPGESMRVGVLRAGRRDRLLSDLESAGLFELGDQFGLVTDSSSTELAIHWNGKRIRQQATLWARPDTQSFPASSWLSFRTLWPMIEWILYSAVPAESIPLDRLRLPFRGFDPEDDLDWYRRATD